MLCHDISVHIPHHISQKIPSYNLRLAHESLVKNWGKVCLFLSPKEKDAHYSAVSSDM